MTDLLQQVNQYTVPSIAAANAIIITFVTFAARRLAALSKTQANIIKQQTELLHLLVGVKGEGGIISKLNGIERNIAEHQTETKEAIKYLNERLNRHHHAIAEIQTHMKIQDHKMNP